MNNPPYIISEELQDIVTKMNVSLTSFLVDNGLKQINFDHGAIESINQRLDSKSRTVEFRVEKYPLIWLREPFTVVNDGWGYLGRCTDMNIFFIMETDKNYTEEQRKELIFKKIIIPVYNEFIRLFRSSLAFSTFGQFKHQYTDYNYWGENQKTVLNDSVDVRKLTDIDFKVNNNRNCLAPQLITEG